MDLKVYGYKPEAKRGNILRVALLQIAPAGSLEENFQKGAAYCKMAKAQGADIALFPEMFSCGYDIYERPPEVWTKDAISADDLFITRFSDLAAELSMAIGITYLEKTEQNPGNSMILFDRYGKQVLSYRKVHTCDFSVEKHLSAGDSFSVANLDTAKGSVKVGTMICYDREFPESARILMLKGAEIVLVPNACPMEINRLSQLRGRAYENMMGFATCNYPSSVPDCNGHSSAFDGVAYLPSLSGSRDTCILEANGSEGVFMAEFDLDMMRVYRRSEVHGNAYRRPEMYGILTEQILAEPFVRQDKR
ncbi:MAG: carbon-nitrogen hydrolase family protein [Clostridia bacterium]|nr:carbon-nitrogen hydrolase family protein [Clostridia bacterium]